MFRSNKFYEISDSTKSGKRDALNDLSNEMDEYGWNDMVCVSIIDGQGASKFDNVLCAAEYYSDKLDSFTILYDWGIIEMDGMKDGKPVNIKIRKTNFKGEKMVNRSKTQKLSSVPSEHMLAKFLL